MKIIQKREVILEHEYELFFQSKTGNRGAGYGFPCGPTGMIYASGYHGVISQEAKDNYKKAMSGVDAYPPRVNHFVWERVVPRIGLCDVCGEEVILDDFTCPCPGCSADYNSQGQRLAPREQWGQDTGEDWRDIARITWRI